MYALLFSLQRAIQLQPVKVLLHDHAQHQRRLALMANTVARRVFITLPHLGHIGDAQHSAVGDHRYVLDLLQTVEGTVQTDIGTRSGGFHRARRRDRVLAGQRSEDLLRRQPQRCQALIRKLDVNALRLLAENVDLLHPGQLQKVLPHLLGQLHQLAVRQLAGLKGVKGEIDVVVFVVEEGARDAARQAGRFVTQLFAGLVEQLGHQGRRGRVEKLHLHRDKAGLGGGFHPVVIIQLLQTLLQPVGDLLLHLARGRARPDGGDGHHLDGEGGVFGAAQLAERKRPGQQHRDDQKQRHCRVANRQRRQVETAHVTGSVRLRTQPACPRAAASRRHLRAADARPARPPADRPQGLR